MRIIGGSAGSRRIEAPRGLGTRPTRDKVREALFSMLQGHIAEARVLDLFAGSGALGLESLSRGAAFATFVERSRPVAALVRRNIESLGFADQAEVLAMDAAQALEALAPAKCFDLVFLDPPYRMDTAPFLGALSSHRLLSPGAILAIEHSQGQGPKPKAPYRLLRQRAYGDTELTLLIYEGGDPAAAHDLSR